MRLLRGYRVLLVVTVCAASASHGALQSEPVEPPYTVHGVIVLPAEGSLPEGAADAYATLIADVQAFFANEMERHGYGRRTFTHELDADTGLPKLHVVQAEVSRELLAEGTTRQHHDKLIGQAIMAGLGVDTPGQVWMILSETWTQAEDGSLDDIVALGIRGRRDGNENNGVGVRNGPILQAVRTNAIDDDSGLIGTTWDVLGPQPLTIDSFRWFEHATRSGLASSMIGSFAHELGHAFGLLHVYENDRLWTGDLLDDRRGVHFGVLMGNGFRAWRSWVEPSVFSTPETPEVVSIDASSAALLSLSPFFDGSDPSADPTPPVLAAAPLTAFDADSSTVTVAASVSDAESGIACVQLYNGIEVVWTRLYDSRPASLDVSISTDRLPGSNTDWRLRVFNGSFQERAVTLRDVVPPDTERLPVVHIVPSRMRAAVGEETRFIARPHRLASGETLEDVFWSFGGDPLADFDAVGDVADWTFDALGGVDVSVVATTSEGRRLRSAIRVYVDP